MRRDSPLAPEEKVERPSLVWEKGGGTRVEHEVWPERPLTIGRDETNTIVVESSFVSTTHAVIRYIAGQYRVEDLKSANGTRVNGAPVATSVLVPGDVLEVGDQRFVFIEREKREGGGGLSKNTKLALTAIASLGVFGMLFALLASSGSQPSESPSAGGEQSAAEPTGGPAPAPPPVNVNSAAVGDVLATAQQAGIKPVDALFDAGVVASQAGRLREAAELFGAVAARDAKHDAAARRLEEAKTAWAKAIADHTAEAERAYDELRLQDAILEWGTVVLLTDESDVRYRAAQEGIERARKRLPR